MKKLFFISLFMCMDGIIMHAFDPEMRRKIIVEFEQEPNLLKHIAVFKDLQEKAHWCLKLRADNEIHKAPDCYALMLLALELEEKIQPFINEIKKQEAKKVTEQQQKEYTQFINAFKDAT